MTKPDIPAPALGAGAIVFRGDEVLLIRRSKPPLAGQWSLPGGRVEFGERAEDAARRELAEETGVQAAPAGFVGMFEFIGEGHHYVLVDYGFRWTAGEPRPGDDASDARFFAPGELAALDLWAETRRAIDLARAVIRRSEAEP